MNSFSRSNINEIIRAVLNSLFFFFYEKILHIPKAPKAQKAQKRNQTKAQTATSEQKLKMCLKNIEEGKSHLFAYSRFRAFCALEEKRIEKRR